MKRIALILAATFPVMAFAASQNTITFNGQVTDQTCTVAVNGNAASPMILLPTVSATSLSAANSKAGETPFTGRSQGASATVS
ncbi:fimbrial protein [Pseudomonas helleri]|uniref:fimbrial protein n=1 Tax=Pseudomonas helleri TaxID=1608996 RepID=UPI00069D5005|nr:type 1 fimbrial protein [Pseudomonas helleri]